jgi:splicing suppressor protein 51
MLDEFVGELRATEAQGAPEAMIAPFIRAASEGLSMPMTIMWALEVLHGDEEWTHCQELVVHVRSPLPF